MKNLQTFIIIGSLFTLCGLGACNNEQRKELSPQQEKRFLQQGDSIAGNVQKALLQKVSQAIQQAGTGYAVQFCNLNALSITDSLAQHQQVTVQRLSNKNRNPANAIQTPADSAAWAQIVNKPSSFIQQQANGKVYYYQPITIAMNTCIKCHGNKTDIADSTLNLIQTLYPHDKAIGYALGDLRGMWKIGFETASP